VRGREGENLVTLFENLPFGKNEKKGQFEGGMQSFVRPQGKRKFTVFARGCYSDRGKSEKKAGRGRSRRGVVKGGGGLHFYLPKEDIMAVVRERLTSFSSWRDRGITTIRLGGGSGGTFRKKEKVSLS